jgi:hypothetical protein
MRSAALRLLTQALSELTSVQKALLRQAGVGLFASQAGLDPKIVEGEGIEVVYGKPSAGGSDARVEYRVRTRSGEWKRVGGPPPEATRPPSSAPAN